MSIDQIIESSFTHAVGIINEKQNLNIPQEMIEKLAAGIMAAVVIQDGTREQIETAIASGEPEDEIIKEVGEQLYEILKEQLGDTALFNKGSQ